MKLKSIPMKLSHKCDKYSIKELRRVGKLVIKASREIIGHGNKPIPKLHIRNSLKDMYGLYCYSHKIFINPSQCKKISVFVGVIIHEYTHHIQKGLKQNYDGSVKKYGYYDCPFEVEARGNAKKYKKKVWKKVKQELS
jgi:hypothetical protein